MAIDIEVRCEILKSIANVITTLVDEAKFVFDKDGVTIKVVDPAHVAMVGIVLAKGLFEKYTVKGGPTEIGIDIKKITDVLKLASGKDDIIKLGHDEEKNSLVVVIGNITRRMLAIDTSAISDPKVPNLTLPVKILMDTSSIALGVKAAEAVSDTLAINATPDKFILSAKSELDSVDLTLTKDMVKELECKEAVKSAFSLSYFSNMLRSVPSDTLLTISMGQDYPIRLEFDISEGKGKITYVLAPRIDDKS